MKTNLFEIANKLHQHLLRNGIKFNEYGYPIIPKEMILETEPSEIIPFQHKNQCKDKSKAVVCFFENDLELYRRLNKLEEDIEILKEFQGVTGFDLSPRLGWDEDTQKFNILINLMVNAYRGLKGIKILPNFRIGNENTLHSLSSYPPKSNYAVGSLGCSKGHMETNLFYLKMKLFYARPNKLFVHGSLKKEYEKYLKDYGIEFKLFTDFRTASYSKWRLENGL